MYDLGNWVRGRRAERHMSQEELAEAAGVSLSTIQRVELNKLDPRLSTVEKIAKVLGIKPNRPFSSEIYWGYLTAVIYKGQSLMYDLIGCLGPITVYRYEVKPFYSFIHFESLDIDVNSELLTSEGILELQENLLILHTKTHHYYYRLLNLDAPVERSDENIWNAK